MIITSMGGAVNAFSTQTSIAAPEREAGCLYCQPSMPYLQWASCAGEEADAVDFRSRGIVLQVDPSPRLRLGTFNGRRPTRESLIGNGGSAPPVSRFLYRPAL